MTDQERVLLIQIIANVDDIVGDLTTEQKERNQGCINKIIGNFHNLLEGVANNGGQDGSNGAL